MLKDVWDLTNKRAVRLFLVVNQKLRVIRESDLFLLIFLGFSLKNNGLNLLAAPFAKQKKMAIRG